MGDEHPLIESFSKTKPSLIISHLRLNHFFHFLFFAIGLSLGVIISLCITNTFQTFTTSTRASLYSLISSNTSLKLELSTPQTSLSPQPKPPTSKSPDFEKSLIIHDMNDDELFLRASNMGPRMEEIAYENNVSPKVAFLFLTIGPLPLALLWEKFFHGHQGYYSIYVHADPFFNETMPQDSVFYGRRIPSQPVYWGSITMIDAERRLLGNALLDFSNKRFVLLSESCIPLFNFTTIYSYLLASNLSFLGSFDDPGPHGLGRYSPQMLPLIEASHWRKGAQWFELHRELALLVVSDRTYYPLFRDFCQQSCYSDEHYLQTLVNIRYGAMSANRTVTWVDWSAGGAHPEAFGCDDVSDELLNRIRFGSGQCELNGVATSMCFLFARKFSPEALEPLLKVAPLLLGFDQ